MVSLVNSETEKIEVKLQWKEKMKVLTFIRDFNSITMDDHKKGDNSAPSPLEIFLSSVGACLIMLFIHCLNLSNIHINPEDFNLKIAGYLGRVNERLRITEVEAEFIIQSKNNNSKIQRCFKKFQLFCILSESIQAGIRFTNELKIINK